MNLNQMVTTEDDTVWFIDRTGRGIIINRPAPRVYRVDIAEGAMGNFVVMPDWFPLPNPDDYLSPTYNTAQEIARRMQVYLAPRVLVWENDGDIYEGWFIDYGSRHVYFDTSIDGALLTFVGYSHIPAIPL